MGYFTIRHIREWLCPQKRLSCRRSLWTKLLHELRSRGEGRRESGAFLLGRLHGERRFVEDFILYDDIDPNCLQGGILFDGSKMDLVWKRCRSRGFQVVADVHTHPCGYRQSGIDQQNPMIPERGHLALIIPNYADKEYLPGRIGIYEFLGRAKWKDHSPSGDRFFAIKR